MAKINQPKVAENVRTTLKGTVAEKGDRILTLLKSGFQDVRELATTYESFALAVERKKTVETDNYVKKSRAETDVQKEINRHNEEMAKLENEWKKVSDEAADRERRLSFIKGQIDKFQAEYDKYMAMENEDFLSSTVTSRLESLRRVILELTKELNKA